MVMTYLYTCRERSLLGQRCMNPASRLVLLQIRLFTLTKNFLIIDLCTEFVIYFLFLMARTWVLRVSLYDINKSHVAGPKLNKVDILLYLFLWIELVREMCLYVYVCVYSVSKIWMNHNYDSRPQITDRKMWVGGGEWMGSSPPKENLKKYELNHSFILVITDDFVVSMINVNFTTVATTSFYRVVHKGR